MVVVMHDMPTNAPSRASVDDDRTMSILSQLSPPGLTRGSMPATHAASPMDCRRRMSAYADGVKPGNDKRESLWPTAFHSTPSNAAHAESPHTLLSPPGLTRGSMPATHATSPMDCRRRMSAYADGVKPGNDKRESRRTTLRLLPSSKESRPIVHGLPRPSGERVGVRGKARRVTADSHATAQAAAS